MPRREGKHPTGNNDDMRPAEEFYDDLGIAYDRMVNWSTRLERESPFFRSLFEQLQVSTILDTACGTGRHAIEFARWGHTVSACDISSEMVRLARQNAVNEGVNVDFFKARLDEIAEKAPGEVFDAIVCLGNSLPHLLTQHELDRAVRSIKRALAPGGVFIAQIRNYKRIIRENLRFMPPSSFKTGEGEYIFFRMLDIHNARRVDFHIIRFTRRPDGGWTHKVQTTRLRPIVKRHLDAAFKRAGFSKVEYYGDYSFTPFARAGTLDLISVAG